jgi:bifunctional oligoribonuclease and PAP phosphatase NrnA
VAETAPPRDAGPPIIPVEDGLRRAAEILGGAPRVALACHVNPDPDALGSMLGLSAFLRSRGTETVCSYGNDPFDPPRWVSALPAADALVPPKKFPRAPEILVTLDCASLDRLGNLSPVASRAGEVVWIDHHASNPGLGTVPVIDPTASSAAELVYRLLRAIGGELSADAAACLYAGIVTDTGRFQYQATTPETLRLAAELRELPFDHARLAQALFEDQSVPYLRVLATALQRVQLVPDASLVWTYLTQADIAAAGIPMGEADDLIDVIRSAREADVACVIKQLRDGRFKVSVRSRGGVDLSALTARFGGGGHRLAAGYTSRLGLEQTVAQLVSALRDATAPAAE